jgi:HK97 gp10 family phage protein
MGLNIDLTDARAVASRIGTSGGRIGAAASAALRKTALDIEADAKQLAPVDTGNLRNSISSDITGDGRHGAMSAEIGPTAEYGVYQEYGTSTQPGQPFLSPAYDRRIGPYSEALAQLAARAVLE